MPQPVQQRMTRLLLIEDDAETAEEVAGYFRGRGYEVERAATGPDGLARAGAGQADVMVVDRLLPGLDGLAVIEALRHAGVRTPALVLSALDGVDERVRGLRAGGDDYLGKPFALAELAARIEALLRRPANGPETLLRVGPLELDLVARTARRGERVLDLLPREFRLLEYMMRRVGQTVTRTMLFEDVWNYHFTPRSTLVDVHMGRLRRKLDGPLEVELMSNVRGIGFVLDAPP
jgi:two-component system OmpR family response regulator